MPFDPFAMAKTATDFAWGLAAKPAELLEVQMQAARQWGDFWTGALSGKAAEAPRDRRFAAPEYQDAPYYRGLRDSYLLASEQLRDFVARGGGEAPGEVGRAFGHGERVERHGGLGLH